jgi:hypothetical protein
MAIRLDATGAFVETSALITGDFWAGSGEESLRYTHASRHRYAQTQAEPPESAQISAAIRSCSAFGASCGAPWPP